MKLYHFTSKHHIRSALKDGLTLGCIPLSLDPPELIKGYQWLTRNSSFDQSWCGHSSLPYNRNDYRIQLAIPKKYQKNLHKWLPCGKIWSSFENLGAHGDPENWYLYNGFIIPKWFKKIKGNPDAADLRTNIHLTADL